MLEGLGDSILPEQLNRTYVVCVLLIEIAGNSKRSVSGQRAVKELFHTFFMLQTKSAPGGAVCHWWAVLGSNQ